MTLLGSSDDSDQSLQRMSSLFVLSEYWDIRSYLIHYFDSLIWAASMNKPLEHVVSVVVDNEVWQIIIRCIQYLIDLIVRTLLKVFLELSRSITSFDKLSQSAWLNYFLDVIVISLLGLLAMMDWTVLHQILVLHCLHMHWSQHSWVISCFLAYCVVSDIFILVCIFDWRRVRSSISLDLLFRSTFCGILKLFWNFNLELVEFNDR